MQALYNVLNVYFDGTPVAGSTEFFGGTKRTAPMNYLQLYYQDILYGNDDTSSEAVTQTDGTKTPESFQELLNLASEDLLGIAEGEPPSNVFPSHE